jgi:tetratricopeptide (TPR) repeat protein
MAMLKHRNHPHPSLQHILPNRENSESSPAPAKNLSPQQRLQKKLLCHRETLSVFLTTCPRPRQPKSLTTPTLPPDSAVAGDMEGMSEAESQTMSVRELKEELKAAGANTAGMLEKADLIAAVASLRDAAGFSVTGTSPAYARGLAEQAAAGAQPVPSQPAPAESEKMSAGEGKVGALGRALALKTEGNQHFLAGEYSPALPLYSEAIEMLEGAGEDAALATILCNRSVAYLKLGQSASALTDAERAGALGGGKAHFRRAEALSSMRRYEEALEAFEAAMENAVSDCTALTLLSLDCLLTPSVERERQN